MPFCLFWPIVLMIGSRLVNPLPFLSLFKSLKRIYNPVSCLYENWSLFSLRKVFKSVFVTVKACLLPCMKESYHIFYDMSNNFIYHYTVSQQHYLASQCTPSKPLLNTLFQAGFWNVYWHWHWHLPLSASGLL